MSRVDEALQRAAVIPRVTGATRPIREPQGDRANRPALDLYPQEGPAGEVRTPRDLVAQPAIVPNDRHTDPLTPSRFSEAYRRRLVIDREVSPTSIEQFRRLAASMHQLQAEQGLRRLMVSSAVPREGKTLTTVNLAMTLSESYGQRVLLVDADLRKPSIHEVFGVSNRFGLSDALRSERSEIQFARVLSKLWILPAGSYTGDPMSTLASRHLERLLDEVESSFDWILVDAPPLGPMADAALLARLTRAVLLVIAAGSTPYDLVQKVVTELGRERIVGVVLNQADDNATHWSAYYGGGAKPIGHAEPLDNAQSASLKVEESGP